MSKTRNELNRIPLTWVFAFIFIGVLLVSGSAWEANPIMEESLFMTGCLLAGAGAMGRAWCAIFISGRKDNMLVTQGPYAMCRNPLYFFSLLGALGVGLATETFTFPLCILLGFTLYYPGIIHLEEKRLAEIFGETFQEYRRSVPCFFPKVSLLKDAEPDSYDIQTRSVRHSLFDALWFVWIVGIIELASAFHETGILPIFFTLY